MPPSSSFRITVFDPALVVAQIVCFQSAFYVSLSLIILAMDVLTGASITLAQILDYRDIDTATVVGWSLLCAFLFNAALCAIYLVVIVQRAKLCFDFACTLHGFHLVFTTIYSRSIPDSLMWWTLSVVTLLVMSLGGEYLCMQLEMRPIVISGGAAGGAAERKRRSSLSPRRGEEVELHRLAGPSSSHGIDG